MENLNNVQNLDSIIFYTGEYSTVAAETLENRDFETTVNGLGKLTKDRDGKLYFSNYPNVKYTEKSIDFKNLNDLYSETLSYVEKSDADFSIGYTYIAQNRYNAIYTYETDLDNDFENAKIFPSSDLNSFLLGLNTQKYNKQNFYGDDFEVSSIKIDQTYFKWYPKNTVAYVESIAEDVPVTYTYYTTTRNEEEKYTGPIDTEELQELYDSLEIGQYIKQITYSYISKEYHDVPYIIGGENGNYYSYIRKSYDTIGHAISDKIKDNLRVFENKYQDPSIYAYYMYDCNSDIQMLLTTKNLGIKQSTFKIGFDSKFNKWFGNIINIKANLNEGDSIAKITSAKDGEIFSIFSNSTERITGENVQIDKDDTVEFVTNSAVSIENDTINILTPYSIDTLDLSPIKEKCNSVIQLVESGWINHGNNLRAIIFDNGDNSTSSNIEKIFGLNDIPTLEYIDISNINDFAATPAIDKLENLKVFKADGSNIDSFRPKKGASFYSVSLPSTVKSIKLIDNTFEEGILKVAGIEKEFDGLFNYTPNTTLGNLTLKNIDNKLSYKLVTDWYNVLDAENKLDNSLIYLELGGINWKDVPATTLINLKKFDINPNLSGTISIVGSGNYKWLSRSDYQNITKLYGINAFTESRDVISNKVFKDLFITTTKNKETFEFTLPVTNINIKEFNENLPVSEYGSTTRYKDTLNVQFKGYIYNSNYSIESEVSPYSNRAANSVLDMIYNDGITEFTFIKDDIDNYVYCKLPRSIDTSNSNEIKKIEAGDILLFNGDTIIIFFDRVENSKYEYIKLGSILDENTEDYMGRFVSTVKNWFNNGNEFTLVFTPSERETVINELTIEMVSENDNIIFNTSDSGSIIFNVDIDSYASEHLDEVANKEIDIEYDENILSITTVESDEHYKVYSVSVNSEFDFSEITRTNIQIYCDANKVDTVHEFEIVLRNEFEYSSFDDETNELLLNSNMYYYDEVTNELVINTVLVDTQYDNDTQILTID